MKTLAFLIIGLLAISSTAFAQNLGFTEHKGKDPIEITAEDGVEWNQEKQVLTAQGDAVAKRGKMTLKADTLSAWYRKDKDGDTKIYLLQAKGNIRIISPDKIITGKTADYDVDKALVTIKGSPAKLKTTTEEITAYGSLEYWQEKHLAVARKKAMVKREGQRLKADVLNAFLKQKKGKGLELEKLEALGNVEVKTKKELITGSKGNYNPASGIITLSGSVTLTQEANTLSGAYAEINIKTGISKLFASPKDSKKKGRVKGIFKPKEKTN